MTPQARAPGAARESVRAQLSPQSAASLGADCQSAGSHIAASLKLIAIVNPRDLRDANASTVALLEGEYRLPPPERQTMRGGKQCKRRASESKVALADH